MRKVASKAVAVLWAAALALAAAGCWDRTEINELAIVYASALDYENGQWVNTAGFVRTAGQAPGGPSGSTGGSGGGGGAGPARFAVSVAAPTIREAHGKLALYVSRKIHWDHAAAILIGEGAARHGLGPIIDLWTRETDLRTTAVVFLTRGRAGDLLLAAQPGLESSLGTELSRLVETATASGIARPVELHTIATQLVGESHTAVIPLLGLVALPQAAPPNSPAQPGGGGKGTKGGQGHSGSNSAGAGPSSASSGQAEAAQPGQPSRTDPTTAVQQGRTLPADVPAANLQLQGAGVIREGRLVTWLTPTQLRGLLWVTAPVQGVILSVPPKASNAQTGGPGSSETTRPDSDRSGVQGAVVVESAHPSLQVTPERASISLQVQVRLMEQDQWHYVRTPAGWRARGLETEMNQVAAAVSRQIEREIRSALAATQPLGADIFALGGVLHRQHKQEWHRIENDWSGIIRSLPVEVQVKTRVVGTGETTSPPTLRSERA